MGWLDACFAELPDPRTGNATRHDLIEVVTIALVASVCGAESCVDFADFARDREALFRDFLKLENGLPSHDTFSRLFRLLDPTAFGACFGRFLDGLGQDGKGVVAIDGKTLRRSFDRAAGTSALHVVTAFACDARLVLGQAAVPPGGNEITAARTLLGLLDLTAMLVTGDAIHCQSETAALVRERGGQWLFALKANRPLVLAEVERFLIVRRFTIGRPALRMVLTQQGPQDAPRPVGPLPPWLRHRRHLHRFRAVRRCDRRHPPA